MTAFPARIVFAGTPEFAAISLKALLDRTPHQVVAVYTQLDRPAGRGRKPKPSPVKVLAQNHGLEVRQPASLNSREEVEKLAELNAELMVVVAYGQLLPRPILEVPRLGCINIHASLLPRWRGAAPIQWAILAGDTETGITIMQLDEGLDTGPVLCQAKCPIGTDETAQSLHDRLAKLGADCLVTTIDPILARSLPPIPQDEQLATYAPKIERAQAALDWTKPAIELERKIRAFNPKPVAFTQLRGLDMRVWEGHAIEGRTDQPPGSIISTKSGYLDVATGQGILRISRIQLPGRRPITVGDFLNAHPEFARDG